MAAAATYREAAVRHPLVAAVWRVDVLRDAGDWLVLPDGMVDVVLVTDAEPVVAGPATGPAVIAHRSGDRAVGVRLQAGAVVAALGMRADEARDRAVAVRELRPPWGDGAARAQEALARGDAVAAAAGLARALGRADGARRPPDGIVARAAAALAADPALETAALARALAVSPRHLRRRFAEHVGYGPKRYARIMRLQRLLALRAADPGARLAALAARAGYADQAHLARDCRELAGRSPSALLAQRAEVALGPP